MEIIYDNLLKFAQKYNGQIVEDRMFYQEYNHNPKEVSFFETCIYLEKEGYIRRSNLSNALQLHITSKGLALLKNGGFLKAKQDAELILNSTIEAKNVSNRILYWTIAATIIALCSLLILIYDHFKR